MQNYFKKDLIKIIILAAMVLAVLIGLTIWDNQSGTLESLSGRYF